LTVRLSKDATYEEICQAMALASQQEMKGILAVTDEQVVSSDFKTENGRFKAPNFVAIPKKNQSFEIQGATVVNLLNQKIWAKVLIPKLWNTVPCSHLTENICSSPVEEEEMMISTGLMQK